MSNDDGGLAFPRITQIQTQNSINWERPEFSAVRSDGGMALRDYFAAKAMQQIIGDERFVLGYDPDQVADRAYEYADAMLKARKQ